MMTTDRPRQSAPAVHCHELWFLLAWVVIPALLRLLTLIAIPVRAETGLWTRCMSIFHVLCFALPQDLAIAFQALLAVLVARAILQPIARSRTALLSALLATGLFLILHVYLLVDFLLYAKIGIRMDHEFLEFLATPGSFISSARELGLGMLSAGLAGLLIVCCLVFIYFRRAVDRMRLTVRSGIAMPLAILVGMASLTGLPVELAYAINNTFLNDESALAGGLFHGGQLFDAREDGLGLTLATPQAEVFKRARPDYPLLKNTTGFTGPRRFELRIDPGEQPHVVFLYMESFRAADVGVLGGKHNASPCFDRLSREGVLFTRFYGNGVLTTHGVIASLFGVMPPFTRRSPQSPGADVPMIGIADLFNRRGYTNAYFFGGSLKFENQSGFFGSHGYSELHGIKQLDKAFPSAPRTSWGIHDEYLMRYVVDQLAEKDRLGTPACLTAFTITNHHPWRIPAGHVPPKFNVQSDEYRRFLETFSYSDHCLGLFMDLLRRRGLAEKTIVFVLADTSTPMGEHHDNYMLINYLHEENSHIPFLILADGRLPAPTVVDELGSQVDLLPTVMDLFGMTGLNHAIGTTMVRPAADRTAYAVNPFALQYLALRQANYRYIFNVRSRGPSLYDLGRDPHEDRDLAAELPALVEQYGRRSIALNGLVSRLFREQRLAPPAADVSDNE